MGVSEMTRFGFGKDAFAKLAGLIADCVLNNRKVADEVEKLRSQYTEMQYCFSDAEMSEALNGFAGIIGL